LPCFHPNVRSHETETTSFPCFLRPEKGLLQNRAWQRPDPSQVSPTARRIRYSPATVQGITMSELPTDKIIGAVTNFYLESRDFNGISAAALAEQLDTGWQAVHPRLKELIDDDLVGVLYAETVINPHIIRLGFEQKETQLAKLAASDLHHTCIYP